MPGLLIVEYLRDFERNAIVPFGLNCIMSEALRRGFPVRTFPAPAEVYAVIKEMSEGAGLSPMEDMGDRVISNELTEFAERVSQLNPHVIGFTSYESHINVVEFLIRLLRNYVDAYFVIGGPFATTLKDRSLTFLGADFAFLGEAEITLSDFLSIIGNARPSSTTPQSFAPALEHLRSIAVRGVHREPDFYSVSRLPDQVMEEFEVDFQFAIDYLESNFESYKRQPILSYISSRGCPHSCIFCSGTLGKKFRKVSSEKMLSDLIKIRGIAEKRFADSEEFIIAFGDDNHLLDRHRAMAFLKAVDKEQLNRFFRFTFQASVHTLFKDCRNNEPDLELIEAIKQANVRFVTIGTDNFCDEELRRLRKGHYTKKNILTLVEVLEHYELHNNHFCILSNLYTTPENIKENLQTIADLDEKYRYFVQLRPIMYMAPYYGTDVWHEINRNPTYREENVEKLRLLFKNDGSDTWLADKVLPLNPITRKIIFALEHEVTTLQVGTVPYYYDFAEAIRTVDRLAQRT